MIEEILINYIKTNNLFLDIKSLFLKYNKMNIFLHSENVSQKATELAEKYDINKNKMKIAAFLHDISGIIKNEDKIALSESMNMEILKEERQFPLLIHQKLSKEIAKRIFCIEDEEILQAISCHTTLRRNPTKFDMILFISDKIEWDQADKPPYLKIVEDKLQISLEKGVKAFIDYQIENKEKLLIVHPWLIEAYNFFNSSE